MSSAGDSWLSAQISASSGRRELRRPRGRFTPRRPITTKWFPARGSCQWTLQKPVTAPRFEFEARCIPR